MQIRKYDRNTVRAITHILETATVSIVVPRKLTYRNNPCLDLALNGHLFYLRSPFSIKIWRRKYIFTGKLPKITTQPRAETTDAHACSILRNKECECARVSAPQGSGYYKNNC